ncbi:MAG: 2'-5' RNA ligase family protein [Sphingomicrobium sp.]
MARPLIVTAALGSADQGWFDRQRKTYFPPERNLLEAHLTMFHALPPSVERELSDFLKRLVARPRPSATCNGLMNLGRGVAYRIHSPGLEEIRSEIAEHFAGMLSAQDQSGWRPHITVQNKVGSDEARRTLNALSATFEPRQVNIHGLALYAYDGGPWITLGKWPFRF